MIIGLDLSLTNTGLVALRVEGGDCFVAERMNATTRAGSPMGYRQMHIVNCVLRVVLRYLRQYSRVAVIIEDYSTNRLTGKLFERVEITAMVKFILSAVHGVPVYTARAKSVKAFMGNGSFDKDDMKDAAKAHFKFEADNEHLVDAYCLTRYLLAYVQGGRYAIEYLQSPELTDDLLQPSARPENKDNDPPLTTKLRRLTLPSRSQSATASAPSA